MLTAGAHPPERAEAELEDVPHDVFDVGRIPELRQATLSEDFSFRPRALKQEGVAIVPELHPSGSQDVDGFDLPAQ